MTALAVLRAAGLIIEVTSGRDLKAAPASKLTDELRDLIRGHKAELLHCLTAANDAGLSPNSERLASDGLELDKAYQTHHWNCPICRAAGRGYDLRCGVGALLWVQYQSGEGAS